MNSFLDITQVDGSVCVVDGSFRSVRNKMHWLSRELFHQKKRVLVIDTTNTLNPHHAAFGGSRQDSYFDKVYCVRTPLPYDLWYRLRTSESFIRNHRIDVVIVLSLPGMFKDMRVLETESMVRNILRLLENLAERNNVKVFVGNGFSIGRGESSGIAYKMLNDYGGKR